MKRKRYIFIPLAILLLSGCAPKINVPKMETNSTEKWEEYKASAGFNPNVDERYNLKPEPYSLASKEKDPELLGPQSTLRDNPLERTSDDIESEDYDTAEPVSSKAEVVSEVYDNSNTGGTKKSTQSMSRSECINMIGSSKFNEYVKKYGGEGAAIRRCAIMKRLKG